MSAVAVLVVASAAFVGTHFLLSHALRNGMVQRLGERGFLADYSLVALITLFAMIAAYRPASAEAPTLLWSAGEGGWLAATLLMWFGSILFAGSLRRNPAFPTGHASLAQIGEAQGVFAITRHPMNWGFASWAVVHAIVNATIPSLIVAAAIFILAVVGSAAQDHKKRRLLGNVWREWQSRTSFLPYGRNLALPDLFAVTLGTLLFLVATWAHGALNSKPAGIWAYFA